jgi:hypothetical protein
VSVDMSFMGCTISHGPIPTLEACPSMFNHCYIMPSNLSDELKVIPT